MTSPTPSERTISIPVSVATHVVIGCVIALVALVALFVYFQLPSPHSHYRGVALALTIIASAGALSYWLWCTSQCLRANVRANGYAIEDVRAELRTAKAEVLAKLDGLSGRIDTIDEEITENRGAIKEVTDAVDDLAKAIRALRECYLQEGTIPKREDEEAPHQDW